MIDLDACVAIGSGYSGAKYSSGYIPPEMVVIASNGKPIIKANDNIFSSTTLIQGGESCDLVPASDKYDAWALGMVLYKLYTGKAFYFVDKNDNIDDDTLIQLYCFPDNLKLSQLNKIQDPIARNLVSQLLTKDPNRRPSMKVIKHHSFLTGRSTARMPGEEAEFDIFISYRVASEKAMAKQLFDMLEAKGICVWLDQVKLELGKPWDQGFCDGLMKSRVFVPLISRNSINHPTNDRSNVSALKDTSPCDNVLLEYNIALELRERGLIELICPILIGDYDDMNDEYSNYFGSKCPPDVSHLKTTVVKSIDEKIICELDRQSLGSPLLGSLSVHSILDSIFKNQGLFVEGKAGDAFDNVVNKFAAEKIVYSSKKEAASSVQTENDDISIGVVQSHYRLDHSTNISIEKSIDILDISTSDQEVKSPSTN